MDQKTVLVVEDEPDNRDVLCSVIQDIAGHKASGVSDGEQALALVAVAPPDLIVLDLMLPGLNGFEVARRLKGNEATRHIPIVAISALPRAGDRDQALSVGCDDFVTKPFNLDDLVDVVDRLLGHSASPGA
jgi:CheY-like chemotaxis protein